LLIADQRANHAPDAPFRESERMGHARWIREPLPSLPPEVDDRYLDLPCRDNFS
jgi:hypothetical protein